MAEERFGGAELTTPAPSWQAMDAARVAFDSFAIVAQDVQPLTSERDQNFRLRDMRGAEYAFKIANAAEEEAVIDLQNGAMDHIAAAAPDLPIPRVVRTRAGASWRRVNGLIVRVLTWLPGALMHQQARTPAMRASLGRLHARLAAALEGFDHSAADRTLLWDVSRAGSLRPLLEHVADPARRALAERGLDGFARAAPLLEAMPRRIIHNDVNLHNVVVEGEAAVGIIDFGDMVRAPRICDVAIAAAYHIDAASSAATMLDGARDYAAAFHAALPLSEKERAVLRDLIVTRLTMTALITNWRAALYPKNADYILRNAPNAWAGLAALADGDQSLEIGA